MQFSAHDVGILLFGGNIPQTVDVNTKTVSGNRKKKVVTVSLKTCSAIYIQEVYMTIS